MEDQEFVEVMQEENLPAVIELNGDPNCFIGNVHPLTWACIRKDLAVLRKLLELGSLVNSRNSDGSTALTWASDAELTSMLIKFGARVTEELPQDGETSLHRSAARGAVEQLRQLIVAGDGFSKLDGTDGFGQTPLGCAVEKGHEDAVRVLLELGADPNGTDPSSGTLTPIQMALEKGNARIAELIANGGADLELTYVPVETSYIATKSGLKNEYDRLLANSNKGAKSGDRRSNHAKGLPESNRV